jgi:SAM-dependent methyltransferase
MGSDIPDQRPLWNQKHLQGDHEVLRGTPSPLAELSLDYLPPQSRILELGCGVGRDAVFFAQNGHTVLATDGSETVIEQNEDQIHEPNVTFDVLDIKNEFPYKTDEFDVVYSNLALHYYSDTDTRRIFERIAQVLKQGGILSFACKSYDSLHNAGQEVEPGVIVSPTGATIHLFTTEYTKSLLHNLLQIDYIDEIDEDFNGRQSKIIRCIAKKES